MVSSYQWWSAKIPRKKSKRPIAMQPCPKSDQDSIPQPVKSLVLFNAVFMTKRLWQWHLVVYLLDTIRSNVFHYFFSMSGSAEVMTCHQIRCTTRSWSPWTKLLLSFHVLLLWRIDLSSCSRRYLSTLSTIGHRKKSSAGACIPGGDLISPSAHFSGLLVTSLQVVLGHLHCILNAKHLSSLEGKFWMTGGEPGHLKESIPQPELA